MPRTPPPAAPPYPRDALFRPDGPIHPWAVLDAIRSVMLCLPNDPAEHETHRSRRTFAMMQCLASLNPRDEVELMYGVHAVIAHQAALASWRLGMNGATPSGENSRHLSAAGSASRTFDTMVKGLERRHARPCDRPMGPNDWDPDNASRFLAALEETAQPDRDPDRPAPEFPSIEPRSIEPRPIEPCPTAQSEPAPPQSTAAPDEPPRVWTPDMVASTKSQSNPEPPEVEGVEPDGSIIVPPNPTPAQESYIGHRLIRNMRTDWTEDISSKPVIPPIRVGDRIP